MSSSLPSLLHGCAIATLLLGACVAESPSPSQSNARPIPSARVAAGIANQPAPLPAAVCTEGLFRCFAIVRTDGNQLAPVSTPSGLGADDLASAYNLDASLGAGKTIAIVDAYGYSDLEADLAIYRSQYGLPACTTANGCLQIVNQEGQASPLPPQDNNWTAESALDVDMASAGCPACNIIVVQADDDHSDGLFIGNTTAATLGATVVSNSWGARAQRGAGVRHQHRQRRELLRPQRHRGVRGHRRRGL